MPAGCCQDPLGVARAWKAGNSVWSPSAERLPKASGPVRSLSLAELGDCGCISSGELFEYARAV